MSTDAPARRRWYPPHRVAQDLARAVGRPARGVLAGTGNLVAVLLRSLALTARGRAPVRAVLEDIVFVGARSILVIAASGCFIGMVVALQFHDTLVRFGSASLLGSAVGLSLVRELGPVVTALMVIARAGSAMTAGLGVMRIDHQIDALQCMAIDPLRSLVVPKMLATVISLPILAALFVLVGIAGGYAVGVNLLGISSGAYLDGVFHSVIGGDLVMGLTKSAVFGLVIGWICTAKGFLLHLTTFAHQGPVAVARVTTDGVVTAAVTVLFTDYLVSALLV